MQQSNTLKQMKKKSNKKIFITGEKGHLGSLIALACKAQGYEIINEKYALAAMHSKKNIPDVFVFDYPNEINILDGFLMEGIIKVEQPDVIFHTAAYVGTDKCISSYDDAYQTNVIATHALLNSLKKHCKDCLFVNFSTTATCDPMYYNLKQKITEETARGPKTWYGMTKWQSEQVVKENYDKWINFLPVFLFGKYPFDTSSIWAKIFAKSNNGKKFDILLDTSIHKQYEYAGNIVGIIMEIINNKRSIGKDIVLTGSEIRKFGEFLFLAEREYKKQTGKDLIYNLHPEKDYLKNHIADSSLMYELAGVTEKEYNKHRKDFKTAIKSVVKSCIDIKL